MITWIVIAVYLLIITFSVPAAYRNGVNDGAGAVKESWNPGYRKALLILRKHNLYRWPDLPEVPTEDYDGSE